MSIINNALSGALAAQAGLYTTSQNVANVMTDGYTRQGVLLSSVQSTRTGASAAGNGVTVSSLLRFSDGYKNMQLWSAASELGRYDVAQTYLTQLEQVMGDDSSSINDALDALFAALNAASVEPTSSPLRQQVITAADALAQGFNSLNQVLSNQRAAVQQQRSTVVAQINTLTADIATLNKQIAAAQASGANVSGLLDARDSKIDSLSGMVGVQVVEQADGTTSVSLKLDFAKESFTIASTGNLGGQLGGLDDVEQNVLLPMMTAITDMACEFSAAVNQQLSNGYGLDGTQQSVDLFTFNQSSVTSMLSINSGLTASMLGFSASADEAGNSENLLAVIAIQSSPIDVDSLGSVTVSDAFTQLVGKLGMQSQQNQASLSTAQTVRDQAEESWNSTSGVNSDEEAVNLIQYQQMYQSNLKVMAVATELFEATLDLIG
ncbi:MAG: flagellar hook-associated protein FlgK [Candidatus Dactylopiibacterium carminicum]|uniref:Flagellar hook-associated protein 1 n=1 Tax=Candidatus Dactylopiibacterium carminicum TaxID=857335 RepID=A0A272EXX6_9RHOO|nr:flagellar hook-associated protein FlgK [Candidatus Dactylopiibacterium carminicum]KAF7599949.1 flagellar hook-associated protein FlgK [Candidatus Dactylopiibacterium carminicum]PAS94470.1 MAG: flagellar hook-associated protein FlgK [Candidatus Dactylopiibacterium carminicum]PAS99952.1 MAG: flagellar hook-associated protein FlgK [Candidatus Dactylopiibacterium carminicum]